MKTMANVALGLAFGLMLAAPASADPYGGEGGGDEGGPRGSYRATCTDIRIDGDELEARCRERDGDWRRTDLAGFRDCRGDIVNDDGNLRCRRGDDDDSYGRGGDDHGYGGYGDDRRRGYARITLYKDSNFRGRRQTFDSDVPDLRSYRFADVASSATVDGGGTWQLCTRPYYRGRCVTVDDTIYNFQSLGINDRAESLRRVR
jgi:hypothetical protein